MNMYRQEKLIEKLLRFRLRKYSFYAIEVECYDRFDGDSYKCRVEIFKGGKGIENRVLKYEGDLNDSFVVEVEERIYIYFE